MDRVDNSDVKERLVFKVKNHRMDNEVVGRGRKETGCEREGIVNKWGKQGRRQ
jgi:hypothetical protein